MRNRVQRFLYPGTRVNQIFTLSFAQNTVKTVIYRSLIILRDIEKFSDSKNKENKV